MKTGTHKAQVGAGAGSGAETFKKSESEPNQIVSAPQHWITEYVEEEEDSQRTCKIIQQVLIFTKNYSTMLGFESAPYLLTVTNRVTKRVTKSHIG